MSLTLINTPPQFSLVGNPVKVKLQTNNHLVTAGVNAIFKIANTSTAQQNGDAFTIAWGNHSVTFTFKTNPDGSGTQLSLAGSLTQTQFNAQIASQMAENYYVGQDFGLTSNIGYIILTAKETGEDYNVEYAANPSITGFAGTMDTEGADPVYNEDFKIMLKVMGYTSSLLTHLGTDSLTPDEDGYVEFEISELLKPGFALKYAFPDPGSDGPLIYHRPGAVNPFQIQYCESINGLPQKLTKPADIYYAMPGGVSSEDLKFYRLFELDYYNHADNAERFLTWCPDYKKVSKAQKERLFFFTPDDIEDLKVYVTITYTDNSIHAFFAETLEDAEPNSVYEILCGFNTLNLDSYYPAKTVQKYSILLADSTSISELRTFILDETYYPQEKHFDYRNSFGAYDHLRFTGEVIRSLETERETAQVVNQYLDRETLDMHIEGAHRFKANTGWLDRNAEDAEAYSQYLNDFLLSAEIYELRGDVRIRIRITANKFVKHSNKENLYSLAFEYEYVSTDQYHSNEVNPFEDKYLTLDDIILFDEGKALTN